jgi:hypothetical protein
VLPRIPELVKAFEGSVQTDLDPITTAQLACLAGQMPAKSIAMYSFPEELFTGARIYDPVLEASLFIWDVDWILMRHYISQFRIGAWPETAFDTVSPSTSTFCR